MPKISGIDKVKAEHDKNYIINGDMRIAQRNTSFAAVADGTYTLDRYRYLKTGAMVHTISQDTDAPTLSQANYLFQNSLRMNLTTPDTSIAATDRSTIGQFIEGYNWANLAQKSFTLSFWVKATLPAGAKTYCVAFRNSIPDRSYVAEYTINTSATWEYKTITVTASPSAGTWNYTNGVGLAVDFTLAAGSTFQTTAGSWQTGNFFATSNQVNGVDTGYTDFRVTGVMINEGVVAPQFKLFGQSVGEEFQACQRYYEKSYNYSVVPGTVTSAGQTTLITTAGTTNNELYCSARYKVIKRAAPSVVSYSTDTGASGKIAGSGGDINAVLNGGGESGLSLGKGAASGNSTNDSFQFTADAEL
jgi:hypothetical protein